MQADPTWEEYPDLAYHERLFAAHFLLHLAFPATPQPEVKRVELTVSSLNQAAEAHLQQLPPDTLPEPLIVRCLAEALPTDSILNRLFEDQIQGADFSEAQQETPPATLRWSFHFRKSRRPVTP